MVVYIVYKIIKTNKNAFELHHTEGWVEEKYGSKY